MIARQAQERRDVTEAGTGQRFAAGGCDFESRSVA